ncbi:MAG: PIN domain-containing protein [Gemmatimonadaceae bacterium]|nr:PIN domain-containing protein [Gemmatimonadaceae bacterium]
MAELFVDTSTWYPLVVGSHPDHEAVAGALRAALTAGTRLVTSNLVVMETHALLLHRAGRQVALTFAQTVAQPPTVLVTSTPELEEAALTAWLGRYRDQDFSLADGVSFAIMTSRRISRALALDRHFLAAGFDLEPPSGER